MGSVARRSSDEWQVTVTARSGHSSGIFSPAAGAGAIYELARIIDAFRRELPEDKLTFNVGLIGGGTSAELTGGKIRVAASGKGNIIAGQAIARGDLRAISPEQIARAHANARHRARREWRQGRNHLRARRLSADGPTAGNRALSRGWTPSIATWDCEMGELDPVRRGAATSLRPQDVDGLAGLRRTASRGDHAPARCPIASIFRRRSAPRS